MAKPKLVQPTKCICCKGKGGIRVAYIKLDLKGNMIGAEDATDTSGAERHYVLEACPLCGLKGWLTPTQMAILAMGRVNKVEMRPGAQLANKETTTVWTGYEWHQFHNPYWVLLIKHDASKFMPKTEGI